MEVLLGGKRVAFTTPALYASRLEELLRREGASTLWCPSVVVESTPKTRQAVADCLSNRLSAFSGIAFTSRAGIQALAEGLHNHPHPLQRPDLFVAALGRDAELLQDLGLLGGVKLVVPSVATPLGMVQELGEGHGRRILCPVPRVEGLEEPNVVPEFLQALLLKGWEPERLNAYVTRWAGPDCAKPLLSLPMAEDLQPPSPSSPSPLSLSMDHIDALVFTSTAEVEGLLKGLRALRVASFPRAAKPVLAAHGPVTASGAARLGVPVDVVSTNFRSFEGIIEALALYWKSAQ